jgi:hypothetical protein
MDDLVLKFSTEAEQAVEMFPELPHRWVRGAKTIKLVKE